MIAVAGQMFIEHEKELDISNQIIKGNEDFIGDNKIDKGILDKFCGDICSEKNVFYKTNSTNNSIKLSSSNKPNMQ